MKDFVLPVISVLMPAFNVEKYIGFAIESVLKQTMPDFELIIINDGSTDETGKLIEEYARKDERIRVYHIENQGIANARNLSLSYARGEYVTYVDSDDEIEKEYLECLYNAATEHDADIAVSAYYQYAEEENKLYYYVMEKGYDVKKFTSLEVYQNYYNPVNRYNIIFAVAWGKLFRRELLSKIKFPCGKIHEDSFTIYKTFLFSDKIIYVNKVLYKYRQRANSIMSSTWSKERLRDYIEQHEERMALLSVMGIEISQDNKSDYLFGLKTCKEIALVNGYINEYEMINQKIRLIEERKR